MRLQVTNRAIPLFVRSALGSGRHSPFEYRNIFNAKSNLLEYKGINFIKEIDFYYKAAK